MHEQVSKRLGGIQKILMAHHRSGSALPSAAKGSDREMLVREFLARVFPAPYRFGSGAVTDANGRSSGQLDVVVEWPFSASFPTPGARERLYLAESVAFVIDVKSDLASHWAEVERSLAKVRRLQRRWLGHVGVGQNGQLRFFPPGVSRIPTVAVGFVGYAGVDRLRRRVLRTEEARRPDAALVIESGAYVGWGGVTGIGTTGIFLFCADASYFARKVLIAEPSLGEYTIRNAGDAG
jgi:hypothetical protein